MTCPSDTEGTTQDGITCHNYAVNYGNTRFAQIALNGIAFQGAPFRAYSGSVNLDGPYNQGGLARFRYRWGRNVKLTEITDGTSTTLAAAEVLQGREGDSRGLTWWGGASGIVTFLVPNSDNPDVVAGGGCVSTRSPKMPCVDTVLATRPRMLASRSLHNSGVNCVRCDGSVMFASETIDRKVWMGLGTSRGSEVVHID